MSSHDNRAKPVAVWVDDELAKWGGVEYRLGRIGPLPFEVRLFGKNDDAIEFVLQHPDDIFLFLQDSYRSSGSILEGWAKLRARKAPSLGTSSGLFSTHVADAFAPKAGQVFAGFSFTGAERRFIDSWADADRRIAWIDKMQLFGLRLDLHPVFYEQFARWSAPGSQVSPELQVVGPVAEEMAVVCAVRPDFIDRLTSRTFEELIAAIFKNHGFDVHLTAMTRDGGYDIVAVSSSRLPHETILIEVKHFAPHRPVGVGIVRQLYGVKHINAASKAILVTSSYFSKTAREEFARVIPWELELKERNDVIGWCKTYLKGLMAPSKTVQRNL